MSSPSPSSFSFSLSPSSCSSSVSSVPSTFPSSSSSPSPFGVKSSYQTSLTLSPSPSPSPSPLRVLIILTEWNPLVVNSLHSACVSRLLHHGVESSNIVTHVVPGAYEIPFACKSLLTVHSFDVAISLGCVIKGETSHFEFICQSVSLGISNVSLLLGVPIIFGVLTCHNDSQAMKRSGHDGGHNHGIDYAEAAIKMAKLNFQNHTEKDKTVAKTLKAKL